jgi:hypothetical protein
MTKGNKIMNKFIDMAAVPTQKANAQSLTCFVSFIASASIAVLTMIVAILLPVLCTPTAVICWISLILEATSIGLGGIAWWIKINAL